MHKYLIHDNNYLNFYTTDYLISFSGVQKFSFSDMIFNFYELILKRKVHKSSMSDK